MQIRLTCIVGGRGRDVSVSLDPDATVAELGEELGLSGSFGAWSERHPFRMLSPDAPVRSTDLLEGEFVGGEAEPRGSKSARGAGCSLAVTGGAAAGTILQLESTPLTVGREGADVVIDDPALSARHFSIEVGDDGPIVTDLGAKNGTFVEDERIDSPTALPLGVVLRAGRSTFRVAASAPGQGRTPRIEAGRILFNRPPRTRAPQRAPHLRIASPPDVGDKPRFSLAAIAAPAVLGLTLYLVTRQVATLAFVALSPLVALWTYFEDRVGGRRRHAEQVREWRRRLSATAGEIESHRAESVRSGRAAAPDLVELVERATQTRPALWERRPPDDDFLLLRAGTAAADSAVTVEVEPGGADELHREAHAVVQRYAKLPYLPMLIPLRDAGNLAVVGLAERRLAHARALVLQAATLHSPRDLVIAAALSEEDAHQWEWLKWLPHTRSDASPLLGDHVVAGFADAVDLLGALKRTASERHTDANATPAVRVEPAIVLLLDGQLPLNAAELAAFFAVAGRGGVSVIWLGEHRDAVPGECRAVVELADEIDSGIVELVDEGTRVADLIVDVVSQQLAEQVARALAPIADVSQASRSSGIPNRVTLTDLMGEPGLAVSSIADRWRASRDGLSAPIGATATGLLSLDLRRDGPHGLVAGTTGSGKSELLQSWVAALALAHPPSHVTFLLIDYKGGAAFKDCVALPHAVGFVTDLDGHLAERVLVSLDAELKRREHVLRAHGAKDIFDLEKRFPGDAPPSLVIVVDEFATLVKEVPQFVEGVVDVAQRGRSLGVHLILATQRPAGAVSQNVRANTNLRVALRVADEAESQDVLEARDAAHIARETPGRAFVRTGPRELVEFQSAYVGGGATRAEARRIIVQDFGLGSRSPRAGTIAGGDDPETELELIVRVVNEAMEAAGEPRQRVPWLPPLPSALNLESLPHDVADGYPLGLLDEPERQEQRTYVVDFVGNGSLLALGTGGSGKTTLLRTIAASVAANSSVGEVALYGLDFSTGGLAAIEQLPHCSGVVAGDDRYTVERLLGAIRAEIDRRKTAPDGEQPMWIVLLDDYGGFSTAFDRFGTSDILEGFARMVAEGRGLGVFFVITADRRASVPGALTGNISSRLILNLANEDEFLAAGLDYVRARGLSLAPGRALTETGHEVQIAAVGDDASARSQIAGLAALGAELGAGDPGSRAPALARLPAHYPLESLPPPRSPGTAVIGIGGDALAPVEISARDGAFVVAGAAGSGRTTALRAVIRSLVSGDEPPEIHVVAADGVLAGDSAAATFARTSAEIESLLERLVDEPGSERQSTVVVVDDATESLARVDDDLFHSLLMQQDDRLWVVAAVDPVRLRAPATEWAETLARSEQGLLLRPDAEVDDEFLSVMLARLLRYAYPAGRGILVRHGTASVVQIAS